MKKVFLIISAIAFSLSSFAQEQGDVPVMTFDKTTHDFGSIKEVDGLANYTFKFKNTGTKDIIIKSVTSSCGCTVTEWNKEPIPPEGSGSIKASYNPLRRPGKFKKSISVQSNASKPRIVLYIEGNVEPKPKTFEDEYPITIGPIRLSSNHLQFSSILKTQKKPGSLNVINMSDKPVKITIPEAPDHLSFSFQPETLQPKQKGTIQGVYDANKIDDWGFIYQRVDLYIDGEKIKRPVLTISATLSEDFSRLTSLQKAQAAKIIIPNGQFDFGTIKQGEKIEHDFIIKNEGKETLVYRKISTPNPGVTAISSSNEIPAGGQGKIHVVFDTSRRMGRQNHTITIITNDPLRSTQRIRFIGLIEGPQK